MIISQRDIAKELGVSPMTVSLAMRNSPRLPESTRKRVAEAARKLGYQPNPALSALNNLRRSRQTKRDYATLAFVTNWKEEDGWRRNYVNRFFIEAKARASQCGYHLEPFWLGAYKTGKRASDVLYNRGIRGLLLAPLEEGPGEIDLEWSRFAAVGVGPTLLNPRIHRAMHNYDQGMRRILQELHARGYRRVALGISKRVDEITERRNSNTFFAEAHRRYPDMEPLLCDNIEESPAAAQQWLLEHKPDCVVYLSWLFLRTLEQYGWRIPRDLGLVAVHIEPEDAGRVAGIEYASQAISRAAVDKLESLLQRNECGLPDAPNTIEVRGKWLEGRTIRARPSSRTQRRKT